MALWNLTDKKILIIDDFPEMRSMMRSMVVAYGADKITQARDGDEAVEALKQKKFDIILCDYNLGNGKDGQQVLEEAKHRGLLSSRTTFVMVTAENTSQMVMGALEYQPDAYLSKPITKQVLQIRLKKLLEKKASMLDISVALDRKDYKKVNELCDQYLASNSRYRTDILRIKSDALIRNGEYDSAATLCNELLEERELPWATFDIGRANYFQKNYADAVDIFSRLIENHSAYVAAYDWLARTQEQLGDDAGAQETLMQATERSPKSILRQRALAEVADRNMDYETTQRARKKVVSVGKGSVLRLPSDFTRLAKVLVRNKSGKDALKIIDSMQYEFRDDPLAKLEASVAAVGVYTAMGSEQRSKEELDKATRLALSQPDIVSADVAMELAARCLENGDTGHANELMQQVVKNNHENEGIADQIKQIYHDAGIKDVGDKLVSETRRDIVRINNQGVALVKQGKLSESIDLFTKALQGMRKNPIINLNAAQSLVMFMRETGPSKSRIEEAMSYIHMAESSDHHKEWTTRLLTEVRELSTGQAG